MPLYAYVGPVAGSKAPSIQVTATGIGLDPGEVVGQLGSVTKIFKNGSTKAVKVTSLGNNVPVFVFIDEGGAAWIDDNAAGTNVAGNIWRAGRAWRDTDGKYVPCRGDHHGTTVQYTAFTSTVSRRWVNDTSSPGAFTIPDAPFQAHASVAYDVLVAVSGGGTATLQVRNPVGGSITSVGTFGGSTPIPTKITVGNEADVLEFMTSDAATKLRITISAATEKL